jgi:hypothetical protein
VKLLAVADKVIEFIYSPSLVEKFGDVDMVLSCGDLPYYYLEYIVTMLCVPLLYVHGNHDPPIEYSSSGRRSTGPAGCINVHGRLVQERGLAVAGLEGSIRYKPQGIYQYTESEMWRQILRVSPALLLNRLFTGRPLDIVLAHAPPYSIHNGRDLTHRGFSSFLSLSPATCFMDIATSILRLRSRRRSTSRLWLSMFIPIRSWRSLMSEQGMVVAFQGERGAYSEAAAVAHFGETVRPRPRSSFRWTTYQGPCSKAWQSSPCATLT